MDRYIVESPHTAGDCKKALKDVLAAGYLSHFDWGCADGDHRGWVVIEAANAEEAMMVVPSSHRPAAKVVKLTKFSRAQIEKMHIG
jgi:hypothetical protein